MPVNGSVSDRIDPRRLFMISTLIAAAANASILLVPPGSDWVFAARFLTSVCMAGVYPIGMEMAASGTCAFAVGLLFGAPAAAVVAICLIWGITIIADSAQFSANVAELSPPELIGTMLTVQTCAGFTLTLVTIHMLPFVVTAVSWRYAFAPLALGPFFGVWAMAKLRAAPEAVRLAGGRR